MISRNITIVSGASLEWNPRVFKEAATLVNTGANVVVLGTSADLGQFSRDHELAASHGFDFISVGRPARGLWRRLRYRLGRDVFTCLRIPNHWQLGITAVELLRTALITRTDYYIVHLEPGLWVGERLLKAGKRVGVDLEDWYSEDLLPHARKERPLRWLRSLERALLTRGVHRTCPSGAMSETLAAEYGCELPTVIYNAFPLSERETVDGLTKDRHDRKLPSIHWYSQTIGFGRGLEDLIAALPFLEHTAEIHLRGKMRTDFKNWLAAHVPDAWRERIICHDVVPNDELLSRISEHDIGFAGEQQFCRSRDLTITNKILHYLLGGLAVVASATAGQREVAAQANDAVCLYRVGDPRDLARQLNRLLASPAALAMTKEAALAAAKETFCWEKQEAKFLETIERALC